MSGSHYALEPMPMIGPASNEKGVLLGEWMEQIEKDIAVINDAVVYQANLVAALDSRLAELRTALRVSGHGSAARIEPPPAEATQYDLRTVTEREADELAALRLEVAALTDALNYANGRADALERHVKALEDAAGRHADALTVIQLREGL